jgi:5-deoxy-glucuronate isomerase
MEQVVWNEQTLCLRAENAPGGNAGWAISPEDVGLAYVGLDVFTLAPGGRRQLLTEATEVALLPLSGSCRVDVDSTTIELEGRESVFEAVSDFLYLPIDCEAEVTSSNGGEFALVSARATVRHEPQYVPAAAVTVEVRGAGHATRQINNFLTPEAPLVADKLIACEVLTPGGNFSSYPPHKHDHEDPDTGEANVEEIYYFRFRDPAGYGLYRQYTADGEFDVTTIVKHGDVFLVPRGYHGPSAAVPGHDMYFLNVLAGPGDVRSMQYADDPAQHWVRASWRDQTVDERLPLTSAVAKGADRGAGSA